MIRLVNSLTADLMCGFDEFIDEDTDGDDTLPIPAEAFEAAGIWGKDMHIAAIDGAVVITADEENDADA